MLHQTLHILTNPGRDLYATITRPVRELCLAHARGNYNAAGFIWEWANGEPTDADNRRPILPRDLARAVVRPMLPDDLAAIVREALATLNGSTTPVPTPKLDRMATDVCADTDLGMHAARDALRHAAIREAALRFTACVTGDRTD